MSTPSMFQSAIAIGAALAMNAARRAAATLAGYLVAGLLLVASGALNDPGAREINTNPNPPLLQSAPPGD